MLESLKEWCNSPDLAADPTLQILTAQLYMAQENYKEALKLVHADNENLEKMATAIAIYLKIDRLDLAQKTLKIMQDINEDDDILVQLASSWVQIESGGDRVNEALETLSELLTSPGPSVPVLNAIAVCNMQKKEFTAALDSLKQARKLVS